MTPLFCSFFTPSYRAHAVGLIDSLKALGLPHEVRERPSTGGWEANCAQKPDFIFDCMDEFADRNIVWIDADARVLQPPVLFDKFSGVDFGAHWMGNELLSGTLFFGRSSRAFQLVANWAHLCRTHPGVWDQRCLATAVGEMADLKIERLPASYCWICEEGATFDTSAAQYGTNIDPVIRHLQESRKRVKVKA